MNSRIAIAAESKSMILTPSTDISKFTRTRSVKLYLVIATKHRHRDKIYQRKAKHQVLFIPDSDCT
jgi:hypothetical protein